jgi:glycosyltransferase involved in cell wall biosynthesis
LKEKSILKKIKSLKRIVKKFKPDVIHSFGDPAGFYGLIVARTYSILIITSFRSFAKYKGWHRQILRIVLLLFSEIITFNSYALYNKYCKFRIIKRKSYLLPNLSNYVLTDNFKNKDIIETDIIYIGRNHKTKGISFLRKIILQLDRELKFSKKKISVTIIGSGLDEKFKKVVNCVTNISISFIGKVSDVTPWLNNAKLIILTSKQESIPNVIIEALKSNVPIVSTDCGDCNKLIENGINGFLVKKRSVKEFTQHILNILDNDSFVKSCKMRSHGILENYLYSYNKYADILFSYNIIN